MRRNLRSSHVSVPSEPRHSLRRFPPPNILNDPARETDRPAHRFKVADKPCQRLLRAASQSVGANEPITRQSLDVLPILSLRTVGMEFASEMVIRATREHLDVREIPIVFVDRKEGASKMSARIAFEAMWLVPRLRWTVPAALERAQRPPIETPSDAGIGDRVP